MKLIRGLRRLVSVLLVLVAALVLPLALSAGWLAAVVTDTDSYVETVGPLADEPVVRSAVADRIEVALLRQVDAPRRQGALVVRRAVETVVESPEFPGLWREASRSTHQTLISLLETSPGDREPQVSIDLRPVLDAAAEVLDEQGRGQLRAPEEQSTVGFTVPGTAQLDTARAGYQRLDTVGWWLPVVVAALLVVALVVSPLRRRTVVLMASLSLVTVGLLALVVLAARSLLDTATAPGQERALVLAVWDVLTHSLWTTMVVTLVVSALLVLVLLLAPRVRRRGRGAQQVSPSAAGPH